MPDLAKVIDGKKYMWDGEEYESVEKAKETAEKYKEKDFEVETVNEDGKFLVYSRRVVTEVVVEGECPV